MEPGTTTTTDACRARRCEGREKATTNGQRRLAAMMDLLEAAGADTTENFLLDETIQRTAPDLLLVEEEEPQPARRYSSKHDDHHQEPTRALWDSRVDCLVGLLQDTLRHTPEIQANEYINGIHDAEHTKTERRISTQYADIAPVDCTTVEPRIVEERARRIGRERKTNYGEGGVDKHQQLAPSRKNMQPLHKQPHRTMRPDDTRRKRLTRTLSAFSYPEIGQENTTCSVVSDLTTPTVVTSKEVPLEEYKPPVPLIGFPSPVSPRKSISVMSKCRIKSPTLQQPSSSDGRATPDPLLAARSTSELASKPYGRGPTPDLPQGRSAPELTSSRAHHGRATPEPTPRHGRSTPDPRLQGRSTPVPGAGGLPQQQQQQQLQAPMSPRPGAGVAERRRFAHQQRQMQQRLDKNQPTLSSAMPQPHDDGSLLSASRNKYSRSIPTIPRSASQRMLTSRKKSPKPGKQSSSKMTKYGNNNANNRVRRTEKRQTIIPASHPPAVPSNNGGDDGLGAIVDILGAVTRAMEPSVLQKLAALEQKDAAERAASPLIVGSRNRPAGAREAEGAAAAIIKASPKRKGKKAQPLVIDKEGFVVVTAGGAAAEGKDGHGPPPAKEFPVDLFDPDLFAAAAADFGKPTAHHHGGSTSPKQHQQSRRMSRALDNGPSTTTISDPNGGGFEAVEQPHPSPRKKKLGLGTTNNNRGRKEEKISVVQQHSEQEDQLEGTIHDPIQDDWDDWENNSPTSVQRI